MLDHQDRDAAGVDLANERGRVLALDAGQAGHGLIEEEQLRFRGQRAGNFQALFLKHVQ